MSVIFHPEKYIIEVRTGSSPVENWLETQNEIIDLLQSEDAQQINKGCCLELLRNMLPDLETAKKMVK